MVALENRRERLAEILIDAGADANIPDKVTSYMVYVTEMRFPYYDSHIHW